MKKKLILLLMVLLIVIIFFWDIDISSLARSPLEKELKIITGLAVSVDKVYLHLMPLYVEIRNLSIYPDENNKEYLKASKIKLYIGLTRLFNKEIEIRRAALYNTVFSFSDAILNKSIENVLAYLKAPSKKPIKIKINSLDVENLSGIVTKNDLSLTLKNLHARIVLKPEPVFSILSNMKIILPDYPNINIKFKTLFQIKGNKIILQEVKVFDIYSLLKTSGNLDYDNFLGELIISGKIFLKSLMSFLGLDNKSSGYLNIDGKMLLLNGEKWLDKIGLDINFDGSFLLQELMQFLKVNEKLEGYIEIPQGKVEGTASSPKLTAKALMKNGNILGIEVEKVKTELYYKDGILYFKNGDINLYSGTAKASVWITLPKVIKHHVFVEVKGVSSTGIFELIKWNPNIAKGVVDGWLLSEGEIFSPKGSFVYSRKDNIPDDVRGKIIWIKGEFDSSEKIYFFKSLEFALNKTKAEASGFFDSNKKYIDFKFKGKTDDINELIVPYQKAFHGDADFNGKLSGKSDDPEININFTSNLITFALNEIVNSASKEPFTISSLSGKLSYRKNMLVLDKISNSDILIQGDIRFPDAKALFDLKEPFYNLTFNIKNFEMKDLYIESLKNSINTKISISGSVKEKGVIAGKIQLTDVLLGKEKIFDRALSSVKYEKNLLYITEANFYSGADNISAEGHINFNGEIKLTGKSKQFEIFNFIKTYAEKIGAKYLKAFTLKNLNFDIKGLYKNPEISAKSEISLKNTSGKTADGNIVLNLHENIFTINSSLLKTASFNIEGSLDKKQWDIKGKLNSTRLDSLFGLFINNLPEDLVILANGKIDSSIINDKVNAKINMPRLFTRLYGVGLNNKSPLNITVKDGNIYFDPVTFIGQSTELTIKGKVVDYFDILIEGFTDLRPFKALLNVDDIRGRASMLVYIYENRKDPEIAGGIDIINSSLTLKKDIPTLSNFNATLSFNEDRLIVEKANGIFSEGAVQLGGTVYLKDFDISKLALIGKFNSVRWIFSPRSWGYLDGDFYLTGSKLQPMLTGNINIKKGIYAESLDWVKLALKSGSGKTTLSKDMWINKLKLNLRILSNDFNINNNLALMSLKGDILLRGEITNPSLVGWITAKEGWIYFRGNKFEILRFLVQFNDPNTIRPYLNISARTNVSQYNVNLNLNGYLDQFNMILSSNPPLAENELLNLLVLGQNGTTKGQMVGATEATSFITGQIQGVIEERIRGLTGLDVINVEPGISKTTGSISPRVTIGKKLMDGKLTVTYSTATGTTAEQIIKVEYLIKKGISLVGLRDEIGGLSGAVKFRFEFH